jgi:hypothetical protein
MIYTSYVPLGKPDACLLQTMDAKDMPHLASTDSTAQCTAAFPAYSYEQLLEHAGL